MNKKKVDVGSNFDEGIKPKQHQFSCHNCGSSIVYHIGEQVLKCQSCASTETIADRNQTIREASLDEVLKQLKLKPLTRENTNVLCNQCGASSEWDIHSLSDLCPYCSSPIAKLDTENHRLHIEAIIPFGIEKPDAFKTFTKWIKSRWFAPNVLKEMSGHSKQLTGIYVPHWTFDSLTYTNYRGQRGDNYIEYQTQTRTINGKTETVQVAVTKIRWHRVKGQVRLMFDDVLVLADMTVPKTIINALGPWQLKAAKPYTADYLTGLKAQYYQLDLDEAFVIAKQKMNQEITAAIHYDIGGDHQRIGQYNTRYQNSTYKLIMLPVWQSAFEYKGKNYQFVVNGQTGKVSGKYPKSPIKITIAVITAIVAIAAIYYFYQNYLE